MDLTNFKLSTIVFLDSVCFGILLPIISTHIISLGGTHTILGILATFYATFQSISGPLTRSWCDTIGKKASLFICTFITFLTYIPLGLTTSYAVIIGLRLIYALTNETQTICRAIIAEVNSSEKHNSLYSVLNAAGVTGLVIGPIIGGKMFEMENGFYHICIVGGTLLAISLLICLSLPSLTLPENKTTFIQKINEDFSYSLHNLNRINWYQQWDAVLLKYLYNITATVFFIKFSLLLRHHYNASASAIGYTYAYQSILTFLSVFVMTILKKYSSKNVSTNLVSCLFVASVGFLGLCFAPSYDMYLVSFIPMILMHTLLNSVWIELFINRSTKENNIEGVEVTLTKIGSILTPTIFGISCDFYGHYALKGFVMVPLLFCILFAILNQSPSSVTPVEEKED